MAIKLLKGAAVAISIALASVNSSSAQTQHRCGDNTTPQIFNCCLLPIVSYYEPPNGSGTIQVTVHNCVCGGQYFNDIQNCPPSAKLHFPGVLEKLWKIAPEGNMLVATCDGSLALIPRERPWKFDSNRPLPIPKREPAISRSAPQGGN